jgi:hypothetical protein
MPIQQSATKARRRNLKIRTADPVYGVPIPEALHQAIENERSNLSKAESVLGCMAIAMETEGDCVNGPYYPDVAQLARELVRQSINGLDSLVLQKHLLRNKIKERACLNCVEGGYPVLDSVDFIQLGVCVARRAA